MVAGNLPDDFISSCNYYPSTKLIKICLFGKIHEYVVGWVVVKEDNVHAVLLASSLLCNCVLPTSLRNICMSLSSYIATV